MCASTPGAAAAVIPDFSILQSEHEKVLKLLNERNLDYADANSAINTLTSLVALKLKVRIYV